MKSSVFSEPVIFTSLKPDFGAILGNAARQFKTFWGSLLLVTISLIVTGCIIGIPAFLNLYNLYNNPPIPGTRAFMFSENIGWFILYIVLMEVIAIVLYYGYALASLKAARGEKPGIKDLFLPFKQFFTVLISGILFGLIVSIGLILLIIPGIYFLCRLAFVPFLVVDTQAGVLGSIKGSWEMTKGHFWLIFFVGLTVTAISVIINWILALIMTGAGLLYGNPFDIWPYQIIFILIYIPIYIYTYLTVASLYHAVWQEMTENELNSHVNAISRDEIF